jgi:SAM-dependent methyltransferase
MTPETDTSRGRVEFWIRESLRDLSLAGADVLDVGAGDGLFTRHIAEAGARRVVALEPEAAGSGTGAASVLERRILAAGLDNVECRRETFQSYPGAPGSFDILLLHHVVNHLDEAAVVRLHLDDDARMRYRALLGRCRELLRVGGVAVIVDCARVNLFRWLGHHHPLAPTIEWTKHQNPETWIGLLEEAGFGTIQLYWPIARRLRVARRLLANRYMALALDSRFVLHARAGSASAPLPKRRAISHTPDRDAG